MNSFHNEMNNDDEIDALPVPRLLRTYKAMCPICYRQTETFNNNNRNVYCDLCFFKVVQRIQFIFRSRFIRRKYLRIISCIEIQKWIISRGIDSKDITLEILKYL